MEECESSVYIPEAVVSEILLRIGVKSLFRNKCVSKQWNSIISDSKFGISYMNRNNKSPSWSSNLLLRGCFRQSVGPCTATSTPNDDVHVPSLYLPDGHSHVLASSNGLVLCRPILGVRSGKLCVCNPLIKQSFALPLIPKFVGSQPKNCLATRVLQNSPAYVSYKVVLIRGVGDTPNCAVTMYSSDTGRWSDQPIVVQGRPAVVFNSRPSTCSKGVLRWFNFREKELVTYDPYDTPDRFGYIELPSEDPTRKFGVKLGVRVIHMGQEDVVKFGEIEDRGGGDRRLVVWRLYGQEEWSIEQTCLISPNWVYSSNIYQYFCYLGVDDEECVSRPDIINGVTPCSLDDVVPFALCPWASSAQHKHATQNTSFTRAFPLWFSPRNMYRGLWDWAFSIIKYY